MHTSTHTLTHPHTHTPTPTHTHIPTHYRGLPVPHKSINDVSIVHVHNEHTVELLTIVLTQLRANLYTQVQRIRTQPHTSTCSTLESKVCKMYMHMNGTYIHAGNFWGAKYSWMSNIESFRG